MLIHPSVHRIAEALIALVIKLANYAHLVPAKNRIEESELSARSLHLEGAPLSSSVARYTFNRYLHKIYDSHRAYSGPKFIVILAVHRGERKREFNNSVARELCSRYCTSWPLGISCL